jgi:hypothetical protein
MSRVPFVKDYEMPIHNRPAPRLSRLPPLPPAKRSLSLPPLPPPSSFTLPPLPPPTPEQRLLQQLKRFKSAGEILQWLDGELNRRRRNKR